jgi:hypothetical protein
MADNELTRERGASPVEAAFMLPLIVSIRFWIVQFAILQRRIGMGDLRGGGISRTRPT